MYQYNNEVIEALFTDILKGENTFLLPRLKRFLKSTNQKGTLTFDQAKNLVSNVNPTSKQTQPPLNILNQQLNAIDSQLLIQNEDLLTNKASNTTNFPFVTQDIMEYITNTYFEPNCKPNSYLVTNHTISLEQRIGVIDRKLRLIDREMRLVGGIANKAEWFKYVIFAYQSIHGATTNLTFLIQLRLNLLNTFLEYYVNHFHCYPLDSNLYTIARIISTNIIYSNTQVLNVRVFVGSFFCKDDIRISLKSDIFELFKAFEFSNSTIFSFFYPFYDFESAIKKTPNYITNEFITKGRRVLEFHDYPNSQDLGSAMAQGYCWLIGITDEGSNEVTTTQCFTHSKGKVQYFSNKPLFTNSHNKYNIFIRNLRADTIINKVLDRERRFHSLELYFIQPSFVPITTAKQRIFLDSVKCYTLFGERYLSNYYITSSNKKYYEGFQLCVPKGYDIENHFDNIRYSEPFTIYNNKEFQGFQFPNTTPQKIAVIKKYMQTDLVKFLFYSMGKDPIYNYRIIPTLVHDFIITGVINWGGSLESLNNQLYRRYKLTNLEISYIHYFLSKI